MESNDSPPNGSDWFNRCRSHVPWRTRTPSPANLPGLCQHCCKIDFEQFASTRVPSKDNSPQTRILISLFNVIKHQRDGRCNFCTVLFDAIALKRHDPFEHPAVRDYMPSDARGRTFETWAKGIRWHDRLTHVPHPFGQSRNRIIIEEDPSNPNLLRERRDEAMENAEQAGLFTSGAVVGATTTAAVQDTNRDRQLGLTVATGAGSLAASLLTMDNKLPVVFQVKMHNVNADDAGLLEISLWGYGGRAQAPLTILSQFNLRIASSLMIKEGKENLRYGRTMGKRVNIEGDCLNWLNHCRQNHEHICATPQWSTGLPKPAGEHFRLIKIGELKPRNEEGEIPMHTKTQAHDETDAEAEDDEDKNEEYLCKIVQVDIDGRGGEVPEYAALSYVWGDTGAKSLNLNSENVSQLDQQINDQNEKVARTISDAIKVAKRLGFQYLWADSLCVIQKRSNDDGAEARESQLKQMDSIFGHATVVLIASAGKNSEAGLVGVSSTREPMQMAREVRPNVNVLLPVEYDKSYGKWDTRGWTLQEKLLSRRLLVFGEKYVSFHCRHGILREDVPAAHAGKGAGPPPIPYLSMPPDIHAPTTAMAWNGVPVLLRSPFFSEYAKLLEQYTSRDMTKSSDILDGMYGLLKVLEHMRGSQRPPDACALTYLQGTERGDRTLYGLPEEFLDLALLWQPPAAVGTYLTKRANDVLPSWSWAGWEVSKDPTHGEKDGEYDAHPGVRFEEPFWVSGNDDMSLRKFRATGSNAEERFRPLVMWYKWSATRQEKPPPPPKKSHLKSDSVTRLQKTLPVVSQLATRSQLATKPQHAERSLAPVNGSGVGIVCGSRDVDSRALKKALKFRGVDYEAAGAPSMPPGIRLDDRHLVCETMVATFRLRQRRSRKEPLWNLVDGVAKIEKELQILEAEILDDKENVIGHMIHTDQRKTISAHPYDFILLSESQYWGTEKRIDIVGYPLYNVMTVEWDTMVH
ncbi:uncharacterized protein CCOS01_15140 [Colletotrichum costaricense]|uniref:Heterokaryon incompatibility domain-containing protein n=1 Tax=Colletotrichum costaricense TaxID=1209916 RepID=A0AAJ0DU88_9PEZI|nr:uncharacterized protein CCOS01_15140 [Colletotrichum costaricense]KAK1511378.1 hypothetical protein CCOS01_15140 [Colletotrichum costaricense]